jgi:hypothetical protein
VDEGEPLPELGSRYQYTLQLFHYA